MSIASPMAWARYSRYGEYRQTDAPSDSTETRYKAILFALYAFSAFRLLIDIMNLVMLSENYRIPNKSPLDTTTKSTTGTTSQDISLIISKIITTKPENTDSSTDDSTSSTGNSTYDSNQAPSPLSTTEINEYDMH